MIEIEMNKERNLKNVKQIGTPHEEDKVYVENLVYTKLKEGGQKEKNIYVLMGHTERMNGGYATFVDRMISVENIEFVGNIPRWNIKIWGEVFREIKRVCEGYIIVGWAYDAKGMGIRMTPDIERIMKEYFGGNHQLLLLMDSREQEEELYTYTEKRLVLKDGFYIYYHAKTKLPEREEAELSDIMVSDSAAKLQSGYYREYLHTQNKVESRERFGMGTVAVVALLILILGLGIYESRESLFHTDSIPAPVIGENIDSQEGKTTETENLIPVEIISGEEEKTSE